MRLWKKGLSVMMGAGILAALLAGTAFAAESRTKISSVTLTVDSAIETGDDSGDVTVTTDAGTYSVSDVNIVNDDGDWTAGDTPRVEVTLEADDDYYFVSMSSSKVKLKGDKASYVTSHREDSSSTLIVTIKLDELEGSMEIDEVSWQDDNSPIADWEDADGAKSYQVRLYRGSSSVGESVTTTNSYYNFASKITREGEYYFKVRAVNSNSKKGDWFESDYIYVDEQALARITSGTYNGTTNDASGTANAPNSSTSTAQWKQNNIGWWYVFADGTYPTNGWLQINNVWYCFDSVGYMRTGWIQAGNAWYYCDTKSGGMLTNTRTPDNYYVDANGVWQQGR
ncbi:MAG: hypothetical protein PHV18_02845 [Lachnospiraceae bacterium]|nr:hypothetical protein [Lachnospiraceae bacterium]